MKQLKSDMKNGEVTLQVEHADDLWHLKSLIEQQDILIGRTLRKVGSGSKDERSKEASRIPMTLGIRVEKVEFALSSPILRVLGSVVSAPDEVPLGSHHAFSIEPNTIFTLKKNEWLKYQKDRLSSALTSSQSRVLIILLDREEAFIARLKHYGSEILLHLKGDVQKKADEKSSSGDFYGELIEKIKEYDARYLPESLVIASPAFWKEDLAKRMNEEGFKKKIVYASCNSVSENGITEVLRRPEVKEALRLERAAIEAKAVERFLVEVSKEGLCAYGSAQLEKAIAMGAVETLLVSDALIQSSRNDGSYPNLESMMRRSEQGKGEVMIISGEHDSGRQLIGLGGLGAILRFRMNY